MNNKITLNNISNHSNYFVATLKPADYELYYTAQTTELIMYTSCLTNYNCLVTIFFFYCAFVLVLLV